MLKTQGSVFRILILLSVLFYLGLIILFTEHHYLVGLQSVIKDTLAAHWVIFLKPVAFFLMAQLVIFAALVYILWYVAITLSEALALNIRQTQTFSLVCWLLAVITILASNTYLVSHSFFSKLIRQNLFNNHLSTGQLRIIVYVAVVLCLMMLVSAGLIAIKSLCRKEHVARHAMAFGFVISFLVWNNGANLFVGPSRLVYDNAQQPNIFIVGFDALRPDYLSFFNEHALATPRFDDFLKSAIVFNEAYTPLARTFPSWAAVLSGRYPLHNDIREDNNLVDKDRLRETLATKLKQAGYATIFASDDNRFSYLDKEFGFDELVGNRGDVVDFLMGDINDLPLSNLLVATKIGKLLFPYNYGSHTSSFTYDPNNFLDLINDKLKSLPAKPLFMAVHFNVTAFPWERFNDPKIYDFGTLDNYQEMVLQADHVLANFLDSLQRQGLLQHAIVVLISDHGVTLASPGDRSISTPFFQGDVNKILVNKAPYIKKKNYSLNTHNLTSDTVVFKTNNNKLPDFLNNNAYGIDTSFGYGSDILSLKQYKPLLAFKAYGLNIGPAHIVSGRSSFLDIAPTLLELVKLPALAQVDGNSLTAYLLDPKQRLNDSRPLFIESAFTFLEVEKDGIMVENVVVRNIQYYKIDDKGSVNVLPEVRQVLLNKKQRGVIQGDWLLAYYPYSIRYKVLQNHFNINYVQYVAQPYKVLLNLKTGKWTTDFTTAFAANAPVAALAQELAQFYGREMDIYNVKHDNTTINKT